MTNNVKWLCPICKKQFDYFSVLESTGHLERSLAPHLYLTHEEELIFKEKSKT